MSVRKVKVYKSDVWCLLKNIICIEFQNRELQIMRKLEHVNIVKLKYFFYSAGEKVRNSDILYQWKKYSECMVIHLLSFNIAIVL